jgi:hypothetical protein
MSNQITVKVAPIIEYSAIEELGKQVDLKLKELDLENIEATDDNKQTLKNVRAELSKELKAYEDERKKIKKAINDPYTAFENSYKENIANKYKAADELLKTKIEDVEQAQKDAKELEIFDYFNEATEDKSELAFITFKSLGLNITLSASMKSYKDQIDAVVEQITKDLAVINSSENKERLLVKYQKTRDLASSINELNAEVKAEQVVFIPKAEETRHADQVDTVDDSNEIVDEVTFTLVKATKRQIRNIRTYIESLGVKYE